MAAASPGHGGAANSNQEMHFQMSKKIAQLTKVIYSLNTKNDKHEEEVQALKDAHTKELQQHAAETRRHVHELQSRLGDEENMCKKLQNLEKVLAKQERLRHDEKVAFDAYRRKMMAREESMTSELERRVFAMKRDLQEKTEHFSTLRVRFADDKQAALKELSKTHKVEMDVARKDFDREISATRQKLEELNDLEKQKEKINSCQSQSMDEPLDQEPIRCASGDGQNAWQEKEMERQFEFETEETEIRRTCKEKVERLQESLKSLEQDLQQSQGENSNLRRENLTFQAELKDKRSEMEILRRNLAVAKEEAAVNLMQLNDSQKSLQVVRETLEQTKLIHKSSLISSLGASKLAQHTSLPEREDQVSHLQNKLNEAERLGASLQRQKQTLETLYEEEKGLRENQAQESKAQRLVAAKEMQQLEGQHQESLVWINQQHETEMELILAQTHQERKALTADFEQQMQALKSQLVSEASHAKELYESEIVELQSKLEMTNKEVSQLQRQLQQSEEGRSSAEAHILNLCEAQKQLQAEMQDVQDKFGDAQNSVSALQNQLKTERQEFAKQTSLQDEGMRKIQQNTEHLKIKWMAAMRVECDRVRDTMAAQFRQQRRVSLVELAQRKKQEGAAAQRCWEKQMQELQEQILHYKQTIEEQKGKSETSIWQLQEEHQFQLKQATNSFQTARQEYLEGLKTVQEAQLEKLQVIEKTHQQEIEASFCFCF
uniref:protein FAM184A-like n=1 Tax=Myxine glutinosa TaxID=7769 RepID=UPI00358EB7BD